MSFQIRSIALSHLLCFCPHGIPLSLLSPPLPQPASPPVLSPNSLVAMAMDDIDEMGGLKGAVRLCILTMWIFIMLHHN